MQDVNKDARGSMSMQPSTSSPLWDSAKRNLSKLQIRPGSLRASTLTVITSMVGGGVLALPQAFAKSGVIPGIAYFCILCLFAGYSVYVLICCAHNSSCLSYHALAVRSVGHRLGVFIEVLLTLNLFGVTVAYQTLVRNIMPLAFEIVFGKHWWDRKIMLLVGFTLIVVAPLSVQKNVSALRFGSLIGCCLSIYLTIVTIAVYSSWCDTDKLPSKCIGDVWDQVSLFKDDWKGPLIGCCLSIYLTIVTIAVYS